MTTNPISEDLRKQIIEWAGKNAQTVLDTFDETRYVGLIDGATHYAAKWLDAERRFNEANTLLSPLLDYGQSKEANIPSGASITAVILERAKQAELLAEALRMIAHGIVPFNERETISWIETARHIANAALSAYRGENNHTTE